MYICFYSVKQECDGAGCKYLVPVTASATDDGLASTASTAAEEGSSLPGWVWVLLVALLIM